MLVWVIAARLPMVMVSTADGHQDAAPMLRARRQRANEQMRSSNAKEAAFEADREECRDGCRRALVGIGRPHVEGAAEILNSRPTAVVARARQQNRIGGVARAAMAARCLQLGGSGEAVEQRKAEGEKAAGEGRPAADTSARLHWSACRSRRKPTMT